MTTKKTNPPRDVKDYFARLPTQRCVDECIRRVDDYYDEMRRLGRFTLLRNAYFKYLSAWASKGYVAQGGQEGELSYATINHYGNLITHILNLTCQQRLSYEPQVKVNDYEALKAIQLGKGILNDYTSNPTIDLDGKLRQGAEFGTVMGEGFVSVIFKESLGEEVTVDPEAETTRRAGENEFKTWSPFDVIQDSTLPSQQQRTWLILRDWVNKFDLAAEFPKFASDILAITTRPDLGDTELVLRDVESDMIPVFHLWHDKTPACPDGRHVYYATDTVIMEDESFDDLELDEIPVYRYAPRELWGSPYGYTRTFDLLQQQDILDRLISAVLTNQLTFSIQNIILPKGSNLSWDQLYGGLNVIEYDTKFGAAGEPKALQLTSTAPETYTFIDKMVQSMGTVAGINEAMRGNPDLTLKGQASAAAMALLCTNAIQFNSDFGKAYVRLAEQVGTAALRNIAKRSKTTRMGSALTKTNQFVQKQYSGSDLSGITKVAVKYGNPLTQTISGRLQLADTLFDKQKLNPTEYMNVIETGNLETQLESENAEVALIKNENERLARGEVFPCIIYDNHVMHIPEHMAVLASESARNDAKVIQAVQFHVESHVEQLNALQANPVLVGLLKQPVLPPPPSAPPPAGAAPGSAPGIPGGGAGGGIAAGGLPPAGPPQRPGIGAPPQLAGVAA